MIFLHCNTVSKTQLCWQGLLSSGYWRSADFYSLHTVCAGAKNVNFMSCGGQLMPVDYQRISMALVRPRKVSTVLGIERWFPVPLTVSRHLRHRCIGYRSKTLQFQFRWPSSGISRLLLNLRSVCRVQLHLHFFIFSWAHFSQVLHRWGKYAGDEGRAIWTQKLNTVSLMWCGTLTQPSMDFGV